jgi:hypothetical protein
MALDAMGHLMKSMGLDPQKLNEGIEAAKTQIPLILESFKNMEATINTVGQNQVQIASALMTMTQKQNDLFINLLNSIVALDEKISIITKELGVNGKRSDDNHEPKQLTNGADLRA